MLVVIPTFNEAPFVLECTVQRVLDAGYRVLLVDDGSSEQALKAFEHKNLLVLRHAINLGQGAALQTAFEYAIAQNEAILVTFDADGQHRVEDIEKLVAPLQSGRAELVFGSRFLGTKTNASMPLVRRVLLKMGILFNAIVCGLWMTDAHNGLRAFSFTALTALRLGENRMAHATELVWQVKQAGLRWEEVLVNIRYSSYSLQKNTLGWRPFLIVRDIVIRRLIPDEQAISRTILLIWFLFLASVAYLLQAFGAFVLLAEALLVLISVVGLRAYRRKRQRLLDKTRAVRRAALEQVGLVLQH